MKILVNKIINWTQIVITKFYQNIKSLKGYEIKKFIKVLFLKNFILFHFIKQNHVYFYKKIKNGSYFQKRIYEQHFKMWFLKILILPINKANLKHIL